MSRQGPPSFELGGSSRASALAFPPASFPVSVKIIKGLPETSDLVQKGITRRAPLRWAHGAVAQLGERCVRNAEAEGSTPFRSTKVFAPTGNPAISRQFRGFRFPASAPFRSFPLPTASVFASPSWGINLV